MCFFVDVEKLNSLLEIIYYRNSLLLVVDLLWKFAYLKGRLFHGVFNLTDLNPNQVITTNNNIITFCIIKCFYLCSTVQWDLFNCFIIFAITMIQKRIKFFQIRSHRENKKSRALHVNNINKTCWKVQPSQLTKILPCIISLLNNRLISLIRLYHQLLIHKINNNHRVTINCIQIRINKPWMYIKLWLVLF